MLLAYFSRLDVISRPADFGPDSRLHCTRSISTSTPAQASKHQLVTVHVRYVLRPVPKPAQGGREVAGRSGRAIQLLGGTRADVCGPQHDSAKQNRLHQTKATVHPTSREEAFYLLTNESTTDYGSLTYDEDRASLRTKASQAASASSYSLQSRLTQYYMALPSTDMPSKTFWESPNA